jgi:hypothetical protein
MSQGGHDMAARTPLIGELSSETQELLHAVAVSSQMDDLMLGLQQL